MNATIRQNYIHLVLVPNCAADKKICHQYQSKCDRQDAAKFVLVLPLYVSRGEPSLTLLFALRVHCVHHSLDRSKSTNPPRMCTLARWEANLYISIFAFESRLETCLVFGGLPYI